MVQPSRPDSPEQPANEEDAADRCRLSATVKLVADSRLCETAIVGEFFPLKRLISNFVGWLRRNAGGQLSRLGPELSWIAAGQAVAVAGGIMGVRMLTRRMDPGTYGGLALGMTVATFTGQIVFAPVSSAAVRYLLPALESNALSAFIRATLNLIRNALFLYCLATVCVVIALLYLHRGQIVPMVLASAIFGGVSSCNSLVDGIQNVIRCRIIVAWHQGLSQWLRYSLAVVAVSVLGTTSVHAMSAFAISSLVVFLSQCAFLKRSLAQQRAHGGTADPCDWPDLQPKMTSYGWPFAAWGTFTWMQLSSDRWALETFRSQRDVGMFQVVYQLGYYPLQLLSGLLVSLVTPILFAKAGDGTDTARVRLSERLAILLGGAVLACTVLLVLLALPLHDRVFRIMTTDAYASASHLLPWMVASSGLFATAQIATVIPMLSGNTRTLLPPKIGVAVLGVILNAAGARYYGISGVVGSSILQSAFFLAWITWISSRHPRRVVELAYQE
jgi:O-antigen/teichoic acid export membrane protein